ncbi:hypothetical protein EW146_g6329 [Bondarzewia mesenterica]|uniref:F-box domain-containing protein n=1 Tax=Bondarzewia mesenterica TaxID=1095465 RepID=A0A4S4LQS4_9AGAM|nr:hypothetical protein EW146_g6329 [Bondarzewia mesenterica]
MNTLYSNRTKEKSELKEQDEKEVIEITQKELGIDEPPMCYWDAYSDNLYLHLDYIDLLRCASTCKYIHDIIQRSAELQYKIELAADGLVSGDREALSTAECLQLLLDHRKAWHSLTWVKEECVGMPGRCDAYELVGGVFAKTMAGTSQLDSPPHHFMASWLPTRLQPERHLVFEDIGVSVKDFAIDPTQDLLAIVEGHEFDIFVGGAAASAAGELSIHFRSLSANAAHPNARQPILRHRVMLSASRCIVQIVDDVISITLSDVPCGFMVWNWRSGELLVSAAGCTPDIALISPRSFMVFQPEEERPIGLFAFRDVAFQPPDLTTGFLWHVGQSGAEHIVTLELPKLAGGAINDDVSMHTGPFTAKARPGEPFDVSRDARVHVVTVDCVDSRRVERTYRLIIHNRVFMSFVDRHEFGKLRRDERRVPWREWGPAHTRIFLPPDGSQYFDWLRYVHGERVVLPFPIGDHTASKILEVLDFNPRLGRCSREDQSGLETEPTVLPAGALFAEPVETRLPYRRVTAIDPQHHSGYMIDDEHLVGLRPSPYSDDPLDALDVLVF